MPQTALLALTLLLAASDVEGGVASAIEWFEAEVEREDVLLGGYEEQAIQVRNGYALKCQINVCLLCEATMRRAIDLHKTPGDISTI